MRYGVMAVALAVLCGCHSAEKAAEYSATRELGDPASARFRGVRANHEGVICGEVNGKDRQGVETGFRKFAYYSHTGNSLLEPTDVSEEFDREDYLCRTSKDALALRKACVEVQRLAPSNQEHEHFLSRYGVDCR